MSRMDEEPRDGSMIQLLTVLVIVMSAKIDSIAADAICVGLATYAMWEHHLSCRN
ncbi:hypothetical protein [Bifidobacterium primatium]|uniref:hypothetical protein n=1 Tax=Bifidobacterium primatium TaxID=2045438 RepID=UPI0013FD135B|nr:hypothetical protein [Bifidobacterium primatium]